MHINSLYGDMKVVAYHIDDNDYLEKFTYLLPGIIASTNRYNLHSIETIRSYRGIIELLNFVCSNL